jgi:hypothetical protein
MSSRLNRPRGPVAGNRLCHIAHIGNVYENSGVTLALFAITIRLSFGRSPQLRNFCHGGSLNLP